MTRNELILERLVDRIKARHPGFRMMLKQESGFMKFLGFFAQIFNPRFMEDYVTVVGNTVYVPEKWYSQPSALWSTLAHEWMHLEQAKRESTFWHGVLYLFPQCLVVFSLFSLLAIWFSPLWLLSLIFLLCLAPIPAVFRMEKELEAYTVNFYISRLERLPYNVPFVSRQFTSSAYYFMWSDKEDMDRRLYEQLSRVESGELDDLLVFKDVKEITEAVEGI